MYLLVWKTDGKLRKPPWKTERSTGEFLKHHKNYTSLYQRASSLLLLRYWTEILKEFRISISRNLFKRVLKGGLFSPFPSPNVYQMGPNLSVQEHRCNYCLSCCPAQILIPFSVLLLINPNPSAFINITLATVMGPFQSIPSQWMSSDNFEPQERYKCWHKYPSEKWRKVFICAMVRIFSFGERWNVPLNSASPCWMEHSIFHLMKIILPLHLMNICYLYLYTISISLFCAF
jgi:hypothetical protein